MRGNITKRGKNSWQLKFDAPAINGKRQQRYATVRGTRQDAQKELTRLLSAADTGALPDPSNATIAEYVRTWLSSAHEQSPKTLERYSELAERQIIPHLGAHKLQKLKPEHVQQWHGTVLSSGLSARKADIPKRDGDSTSSVSANRHSLPRQLSKSSPA
jgi:hypothetical protein